MRNSHNDWPSISSSIQSQSNYIPSSDINVEECIDISSEASEKKIRDEFWQVKLENIKLKNELLKKKIMLSNMKIEILKANDNNIHNI